MYIFAIKKLFKSKQLQNKQISYYLILSVIGLISEISDIHCLRIGLFACAVVAAI